MSRATPESSATDEYTSEAWLKGYECCEHDDPITYNKYKQGTQEYKDFEAGWSTRFRQD